MSAQYLDLCGKQRRMSPVGGFLKNECERRNQGCTFDSANAILARDFEMPDSKSKNSDVASAEKLLGASKKTRGAGRRERLHHAQCILV
jgi:hypothetical protein